MSSLIQTFLECFYSWNQEDANNLLLYLKTRRKSIVVSTGANEQRKNHRSKIVFKTINYYSQFVQSWHLQLSALSLEWIDYHSTQVSNCLVTKTAQLDFLYGLSTNASSPRHQRMSICELGRLRRLEISTEMCHLVEAQVPCQDPFVGPIHS